MNSLPIVIQFGLFLLLEDIKNIDDSFLIQNSSIFEFPSNIGVMSCFLDNNCFVCVGINFYKFFNIRYPISDELLDFKNIIPLVVS